MDLQITVVEDDLELSEDELGQSQGITVDGPNLTFQNGNSCQLSNETFSFSADTEIPYTLSFFPPSIINTINGEAYDSLALTGLEGFQEFEVTFNEVAEDELFVIQVINEGQVLPLGNTGDPFPSVPQASAAFFISNTCDFYNEIVTNIEKHEPLRLYPNPVKEKLHFSEKISDFKILNIAGKVVFSGSLETDWVDISLLPSGHYVLTGFQRNQPFSQRFVKR